MLRKKGYDKRIYVSLFGIDSMEELGRQILLGQLGLGDESKLVDAGTEIGRVMLEAAARFPGIGAIASGIESLAKVDTSKFLSVNEKSTFLCFDDLERCSLDLADVLGIVNKFVEHDHVKTLIIANEEKITEDKKEEYEKFKEKVIGRVVHFSPDDEYVKSALDSMLSLYKDDTGYYQFYGTRGDDSRRL